MSIYPRCDKQRWASQCSSLIVDAENYYTKEIIDQKLEEIESAITSGCCITPEQVDDKISSYTYSQEEIDEKIPSLSGYATEQWVQDQGYLTEHQSLSGYATEQWVENQGYITGVDLSNYATKDEIPHYSAGTGIDITDNIISCTVTGSSGCNCDLSDYVTYEDMAEYVGDFYSKEEVNNLFVTKQYFQKNAVTYTEYNTTIYNLIQEIESLKAAISACCGSSGETYTRWITVPNEFTCSGTTKYTVEKEQTSTDNINWTDTGNTRRGRQIEINSPDCGYVPPVSYKVNMRYIDGTEDNRQCDGSRLLRWLNPSNWENISGVTVGSCIDEIGNLCFDGFSGLTSVFLPNTVTKINGMAFADCISLPSITIPSGVTYIGSQAFTGNKSLTSIIIPSGVTMLDYATFFMCQSLTSATLSENITKLGDDVFKFSGLQTITIPSGVTEIGQYCFAFNYSLRSVTINAVTPPTLQNNNAFYGSDNLAAIYVPAGSVNAYKTANGWRDYANIIQGIT